MYAASRIISVARLVTNGKLAFATFLLNQNFIRTTPSTFTCVVAADNRRAAFIVTTSHARARGSRFSFNRFGIISVSSTSITVFHTLSLPTAALTLYTFALERAPNFSKIIASSFQLVIFYSNITERSTPISFSIVSADFEYDAADNYLKIFSDTMLSITLAPLELRTVGSNTVLHATVLLPTMTSLVACRVVFFSVPYSSYSSNPQKYSPFCDLAICTV